MNVAVTYPQNGNTYQAEVKMVGSMATYYAGMNGLMRFTLKAENGTNLVLGGSQAELEVVAHEILSAVSKVRMGGGR